MRYSIVAGWRVSGIPGSRNQSGLFTGEDILEGLLNKELRVMMTL